MAIIRMQNSHKRRRWAPQGRLRNARVYRQRA